MNTRTLKHLQSLRAEKWLLALVFLVLPLPNLKAQDTWELISGTGDYQKEISDFGIPHPGSRSQAVSWTDASGNFWFFGGFGSNGSGHGYFNELWKYEVDTNTWSYIDGENNLVNRPNGLTRPGGRANSATWVDGSGNLWLFGGDGYAMPGNFGLLNDLWKFDVLASSWELVSASVDPTDQAGDYTGSDAYPGSRIAPCAWTDADNNLWLYGGSGYGSGTLDSGLLSDLWTYNTSTNTWVCVSGSTGDLDVPVNYTDDDGLANNTDLIHPGGRSNAAVWSDESGNLWLFGGSGYVSSVGRLDDLWMYDLAGQVWSCESGAGSSLNEPGDYTDTDGPAVTTDIASPGARSSAATWMDDSGNLWMFGGLGYPDVGFGYLSDHWKYNMSYGTWQFVNGLGDNYRNEPGNYLGPDPLHPGSRNFAVSWSDTDGNMWLFGGALPEGGIVQEFNDLWKFTPSITVVVTATAVSYISPNELSVTFSGPMNSTALTASNYMVTGDGAGSRSGTSPATVINAGGNTYVLTWTTGSFTPGQILSLNIGAGLEDSADNPLAPDSLSLMVPAATSNCNCGP